MEKLKKIINPHRRSRQEKEMGMSRDPVIPAGGFQHWAVAL
jgi:hypothetical protein